MFNGKTSAVLDLLSLKGKGGVLHTNDPANKDDPASPSVLDVLKSKHPPAQLATATALFQHPQEPPEVHPVVYDSIDAKSIRSAAGVPLAPQASTLIAGDVSAAPFTLPPGTYATLLPWLLEDSVCLSWIPIASPPSSPAVSLL